MTYTIEGEFVEIFDNLDGWEQHSVVTAATIVIRPNQEAEVDGQKPYTDSRVRRALAMAVDNSVCLELGISGQGIPAENHHVSPAHPNTPSFRRKRSMALPLSPSCRKRVWAIMSTS